MASMKHTTVIVCGLCLLVQCSRAVAEPQVDEIILLRAQVKLLQGKIDRQAIIIKKLQEQLKAAKAPKVTTKFATTQPATTKPAGVKAVSVQRIMTYAVTQVKASDEGVTTVRAAKIIETASKKIESMLAEGPIRLTYPIVDVIPDKGLTQVHVAHSTELSEVIKATTSYMVRHMSPARRLPSHRSFSLVLSDEQALAIRKGSILVLEGKAHVWNDKLHGRSLRDQMRQRQKTLIVLNGRHYSTYYSPSRHPARVVPGLVMDTYVFTLNGKAVKFVHKATPAKSAE